MVTAGGVGGSGGSKRLGRLGGMSTIVICVSLCFDESYEPSFISCIPILLMVKFPSLMVNDG